MDLIVRSQVTTLHGWCAAFPEEVIRSRAGLCIFLAWSLMLTFRADLRKEVEERLQQAEQAERVQDRLPETAAWGPGGAQVPVRDWVTGHVCAIRAQLLLAGFHERIDPQALIELSLKSLELLPEVEKPIRSTSTINLAHAYLMLGDVSEAEKALEASLRLAWESGNYFSAVTAVFYQARVAYQLGHLHRAVAICRDGLASFLPKFDRPDQDFPAIRSLYVAEALVRLEWNELEEADRLLSLGANMTGWAPWVELIGYASLVRLWELRGEPAKVQAVIDRMEKMGPQLADCAEALCVLHQMRSKPREAEVRQLAAEWSAAHAPESGAQPIVLGIGPFHVDAEYITYLAWLRIKIGLGQPQEALEAIAPVLAVTRERGLEQRVIQLLVLQAMAWAESGETRQAQAALAEALELGQDEGFTNIYSDGDAKLLGLLTGISANGNLRDPLRRLLALFGGGMQEEKRGSTLAAGGNSTLVEPLSERELEVMSLIAMGLSNREIAGKLYLSPNTLKAHTQNIYSKLDVHNRVEAVNKARELGVS
jgi:LuxR family maltose regulon positive regulatory protein